MLLGTFFFFERDGHVWMDVALMRDVVIFAKCRWMSQILEIDEGINRVSIYVDGIYIDRCTWLNL